MSLKCMIDKWLHKGQISQEEYDAVIKKLEGHDAEIKGQIIREVLETVKEQNEIYLAEREKQIRADVIEKVKESINEYLFNSPMMNPIMTRNEILLFLEQLKEQKNE